MFLTCLMTLTLMLDPARSGYETTSPESSRVTYRFDPTATTNVLRGSADDENGPALDRAAEESKRFGEAGTFRFNLHGGYGFEFRDTDNHLALIGGGFSYFIIDYLSLDLAVNAMRFDQAGPNAWGANMNLLFRWHFYRRENFTLYLDGGAGLLRVERKVPADGSRFNFTPQAGLGATFDIGGDVRLMVGARWHHISNANLFSENPGRDSLMAYVGLSFPF